MPKPNRIEGAVASVGCRLNTKRSKNRSCRPGVSGATSSSWNVSVSSMSPPLAPGPDRFTLLDECPRALGEVLARHHRYRLGVGDLPRLLVGGEHPAEHHVAARLDRQRRARADPRGEGERAF